MDIGREGERERKKERDGGIERGGRGKGRERKAKGERQREIEGGGW